MHNKKIATIINSGFRVAAVLLAVLLFIPGLNPARITGKINQNLSLFTSGFFYDSLIAEMGRTITKGWILESTTWLIYFASMAICLGILAVGAAACFSMGNARLKRIGIFTSIGGLAVVAGGMGGIMEAYRELLGSTDIDKAMPLEPVGLGVLLIFAGTALVFTILMFLVSEAPPKGQKAAMDNSKQLFLFLLPFLALVFVFSYLPLWGWRFAFFDYQAGGELTMDRFTGLTWFTYLFENEATRADLLRVVQNTLVLSGLGILTSWLPMAFAIFLAEIRNNAVRRFIQTFTTIPNFISWVLVYAVAFAIFSTDGFLSSLMVNIGAWETGQNMLMGEDLIWFKMLAWGIWKGLGWSAIMYIAAITAIDPQLYEAATVDGAGRFQKMWHITIPELIPTFMVLLLLSIAGILNNGMEQYLVFENATNTGPITVLDLYVYKLGIGKGVIPLSTVVGMVKSIISVALLFGANAISKAVRGTSIV